MQNFENHFRDLFEHTSDMIHFLSVDGKIQLVNPAWLKTLGYKLDEVIGKSIYEFVSPDCKDEYIKCREEVIKTGINNGLSTCFISKSGEPITGYGQIGCSLDSVPPYTRCVFKNMTSTKLAEKKLKHSESQLQTFFVNGPDAIIIINERQEILEWNPKAEFVFGYNADEVRGKLLSDTIIPDQYREAHKRGMQHFLKTGEGPVLNKTIEITALNKSGLEFFINLSISHVLIEGEWLFIAFISDISDRKRTENALIKKEAELMQAKILEDKKNEFISIASHELRTPLTTIKAYTQLALETSKGGPSHIAQFLTKINIHTEKLNFLLNELLDVSKIQAGKLMLISKKIAFAPFLAEVVDSIQHITRSHTIEIRENSHVVVEGDQLRLEQVITNLISNAVKYSPGKDKIIVRSVVKEGSLVVSFTDFGIGIGAETIPLLFTRFFRVDEESRKFGGLGIGLFISSEIIKQHGGKIDIQSVKGEGSTFSFTLPLSQP